MGSPVHFNFEIVSYWTNGYGPMTWVDWPNLISPTTQTGTNKLTQKRLFKCRREGTLIKIINK